MTPTTRYDAIILGAGAAGLMCAMTAGQRGRRVLVLDHAQQAGPKILISGGGRCNFTNTGTGPERFISDNKHFARSALSRYKPADFVALVRKHGIAYHEKTLGQLFCDGSARDIVAVLQNECAAASADIKLGHQVNNVTKPLDYRVDTDQGSFYAPNLVIATGGMSIPKMGATGFAYELARRFGLRLTNIKPGLVPLTFGEDVLPLMRGLAGVSLDTAISIGKRAFREAALFTHRGLSGPAVLQISSYWQNGPIRLNLLPDTNAAAFLLDRKRARPKASLGTVLSEVLPARLSTALAPEGRMADLPNRTLTDLAARLSAWTITPDGTEGFAKAEVTLGGVDTRDLSSQTMAATAVPGLYVIGEAVDVTGWLGGYNFQWAWASGWCAGNAL